MIPEIKAYMAKARLKRGVEMVKLANRIESLKMQEDDEEAQSPHPDIPKGADALAGQADSKGAGSTQGPGLTGKARLSKAAKSAIFKEVVLAKVREMKAEEERTKVATGTMKPS